MSDTPTRAMQHPHEPEIPPALDAEGRCYVCRLTSELAGVRAELIEHRRTIDVLERQQEIQRRSRSRLTHTRAHTFYFGEDELDPIRAQAKALRDDWASRERFIDDSVVAAGAARLTILECAIELLGEAVD